MKLKSAAKMTYAMVVWEDGSADEDPSTMDCEGVNEYAEVQF